MKYFFNFLSLLFLVIQISYGQQPKATDTLFFKYDDSYLTKSKYKNSNAPDCYYIPDSPTGVDFCFEVEKEVKGLNANQIIDMRLYIYKFNKEYYNGKPWFSLDIDAFLKHVAITDIYFVKEETYIKVNPIVSIE